MSRSDAVVSFDVRPPPGHLKRVIDILQALFGKVTSLTVLSMLVDASGFSVTSAASGTGTSVTPSRTVVDFEDAGVDSLRLVTRGEGLASGDVEVRLNNVTTSKVLATATLSGATEQSAESDWVTIAPNGGDEELEIRVVGDDSGTPILYAAHVHMRTVQARA